MKKDKNKRIKFHHINALRDIGGVFGEIKVKKGLLYRSSYLGKLEEEETLNFVKKFNVGSVIDLRTHDEIEYKKDINEHLVNYFHLPVLRDKDNPAVTRETRNSILIDIIKNKGGAVNYLQGKYRLLVSDEYSLNYYRQFFDILLNNDEKTIVYHCTQGKDRTGVCSALILLALGVDEKTILKDYMRYNTPYRFKNALISFVAFIRFFSIRASRSLYCCQMANKKLLNAAFDEIKSKYGDFKTFLSKGLNLDENKLIRLRTKYLEN